MTCELFTQDGFNWSLAIVLVIALPLIKFIGNLVYQLVKKVVPPIDLLKKYCKDDGSSWAVVTGATDGIGLGFCEVLVKMGFNIVLISRNPDKLKNTLQSLQSIAKKNNKSVKLKTIAFNFKDSSDPQKYSKLVQELKPLDIALLINNVGTSTVCNFHDYTHQAIVDFININCVSMAALCSDVLKIMRQRKQKSALINLSSYMEEKALPYVSLYAATKSFNRNLTEGIWHQYPEIDIMCLKPMFVETPLSRQKKGFGVPDRRECAYDSLQELRWEHQTYGYYSHRIQGSVTRYLVPDWLLNLGFRLSSKTFLKKAYPESKLQ